MANPTLVYVLPVGVFTQEATFALLASAGIQKGASGAVDPSLSHRYLITKAGVAAMTLAAPTKDNLTIEIRSTTAFAHTVTATGLLQTGAAGTDVATFAAFGGAGLILRSFNNKWMVRSSVGVTFS